MSDLRIGKIGRKVFTLPLDVAGEAIAVLAKRGAGKSNTAAVIAEEITGDGCIAEGIQVPVSEPGRPLIELTGPHPACCYLDDYKTASFDDYLRAYFASGWDRLNAKRGSWESNPWVWLIEFQRATTGGDDTP
ncbi:hypothetical protein LCGC14_1533610 [marine sediment metagenome]|uniref:Helicase HerA central domain-containing protein n=1 Tax=marine sediment metagenome TaxID=412755 RepID=A0A0F9JG00_9ZZZZ